MTTLTHIAEMERDFGIEITGKEVEDRDFRESVSGCGDDVIYTAKYFTRTRFSATGFNLYKDGCRISGDFAKPIDAVVVETDDNGDELDFSYNDGAVAQAVLAKLGGIPDIEGGMTAAAGA